MKYTGIIYCGYEEELPKWHFKSNQTAKKPKPNRSDSRLIKGNDVTFTGFVIQACEYALDNMDVN